MNDIAKVLDIITERYYDEIYKFCRRRVRTDDIACDITQDVFLALSESISTIEKSSVRKWLYETASHKVADHYREVYKNKKHMTDISIQDINELENKLVYNPFEEMPQEELDSTVRCIINNFSFDERELYLDRYIKKIDYLDLSKKYNISEQGIRKRVSRLRIKIIKIIHHIFQIIILGIIF